MASHKWVFHAWLFCVVSAADMSNVDLGEEEDLLLLNTQLLQTKLRIDQPRSAHLGSSESRAEFAPAPTHDATLLTQVGVEVTSRKTVPRTNRTAQVAGLELPRWLQVSSVYLDWLLQDVPDVFTGFMQKDGIEAATSNASSLFEWQQARSPEGFLMLAPLSIALMAVLLVFSLVCCSRENKGRHPAELVLQPQPWPRSNDCLTVTKPAVGQPGGAFSERLWK